MSQENRPARPSGRPPESGFARLSRTESGLRGPFLCFFASAVLWLVVASVLALVAAVKLHRPDFLGACELTTYGRVTAAARDTFVYGWGFNALFAVNFWLMAQLSRFEFRNGWLATLGGATWNLALTYGVVQIIRGELGGFALLDLPREVGPVLLLAFLLSALWSVVAYARRPGGQHFVSQWYIVGATFALPLVYLLAQLMVLWFPTVGTVQALAHAWFVQNLLFLWFGASALAAAYYFVPKILGRPLGHYYLAPVGFWTLFLFAGLGAPAALLGAPIPIWLQSVGVVASVLGLVPVVVLAINFLSTLSVDGGWSRAWNSTTLRFVVVGIVSFLIFGLLAAVCSTRDLSATLAFTSFAEGQVQLLTYGAATMILFGASYFILPRLTGSLWPSSKLVHVHFWSAFLGLLVAVGAALAGGWQAGQQLANPAVSAAQVAAQSAPWALAGSLAALLMLVGHFAFALNAFGMILSSTTPTSDGRSD